jgi:S1-C subfamily serine protease
MVGRFACFIALCVFLSLSSYAAHAEQRVALVIGNGAYQHTARLPNPANDARDVAAALERVGFETFVGLDLDRDGMESAAIRFARVARTADVAVFYYSGHAMQFGGINYLMPVDARLTDEADLRRMARLDEIVADLQQARNLRILVLDSCRDNPLAEALKRSIGRTRAVSVGRGLAKIDSPQGMIVAYATQAGQVAEDGQGRNSPFTTAFLKHIETSEEIGRIFRLITADVYQATKRTQLPELSLSLIGEFYLKRPAAAAVAPAPPAAGKPADPPRDVAGAPPAGSAGDRAVVDLTRRIGDAVVSVTAAHGSKPATEASGFVIDATGLVVTTHLVIDKADRIEVSFKTGTKRDAKVIGSDPMTNVALLKVDAPTPLTAVTLGDSKALSVGRRVVAIGSPNGIPGSVSSGVVLALHQDINAGPYDDYIQTDATANTGYIGAPLLTPEGEAVGIVAHILGSKTGAQPRVAFAIPSNMTLSVIDELRAHGKVRRAWLGVSVQPVTKEIAERLGVNQTGVLVAKVADDGPARAGGIEVGDVILTLDGREVTQVRDLLRLVAATPIGREVPVVVQRKGRRETKPVRLGSRD